MLNTEILDNSDVYPNYSNKIVLVNSETLVRGIAQSIISAYTLQNKNKKIKK